jgi:hypothetical protein
MKGNTIIMPHGPYKPFNGCPQSPNGNHCYHLGRCCWCGKHKSYNDFPSFHEPYVLYGFRMSYSK